MRFDDGTLIRQPGVAFEREFGWMGEVSQRGAPGSAVPRLQLVAPTPNLGDLVDYLDATVVSRGRVTVPTASIRFLIELDPPNKPTWWKRLWKDASALSPTVRVTVELVQAGVSLVPLANYDEHVIFKHALEEYTIRLHSTAPPCDTDFVPVLGAAFRIGTKTTIEQKLGIGGQLDALLKAARIAVPLSARDAQKLFWIVYATFPDGIRKHVIPKARVVLDEFAFNKAVLTESHRAKIDAVARHLVATTKFVGSPPKIALEGHTDDRGTEQYNKGLGERRAAAVDAALRQAVDGLVPGLSGRTTIASQSFGENRPLMKARTEGEHARNRRVEILMQKTLARCPRVSLRAVVNRSLKLLPRLASADQAKRIACLLRKASRKGGDDRWVSPQLVLTVENKVLRFGSYPFGLVRDHLSNEPAFGPLASDAGVLNSLETLDAQIIAGIAKVNERIQLLSGAGSAGVNLINLMKAMDSLRAWMHARVQDDASIYSCYRGV